MTEIPYQKTAEHAKNNRVFVEIMRRYHWAEFYIPNPEKAPWHWKMIIKGEGPYPAIINIWPHVAKAHREGGEVTQGWDNVRAMISEAIEENGYGPWGFDEEIIE